MRERVIVRSVFFCALGNSFLFFLLMLPQNSLPFLCGKTTYL